MANDYKATIWYTKEADWNAPAEMVILLEAEPEAFRDLVDNRNTRRAAKLKTKLRQALASHGAKK